MEKKQALEPDCLGLNPSLLPELLGFQNLQQLGGHYWISAR